MGLASPGIVHATAEAVANLRQKLQSEPGFQREIAADPQSALQKVGIYVDAAVARSIQKQLGAKVPLRSKQAVSFSTGVIG